MLLFRGSMRIFYARMTIVIKTKLILIENVRSIRCQGKPEIYAEEVLCCGVLFVGFSEAKVFTIEVSILQQMQVA